MDDNEKRAGLGQCATENAISRGRRVYEILDMGSPLLAYAVAAGHSLAPFKYPIKGRFPDTLTVSVPQASNPDKVVQDMIVDRITWKLVNENTPTTQFSAQENEFFSRNSGIEAIVKVVGAPRYSVADKFTPVTEIAGKTPGWLLRATNGVTVQLQATVKLPDSPMSGVFTLHTRTSHWEKILGMSDETAIRRLQQLGYDCSAFEALYCGP